MFYDSLIVKVVREEKIGQAFYLTEQSKSVALKAQLTDKGLLKSTQVKTIEAIQRSLRENEVIYEYKIIDSLMLCFEVSPTSFKLYPTRLEPYFLPTFTM